MEAGGTLLSSEGGLAVARSSLLHRLPGIFHCVRGKPVAELGGEGGGHAAGGGSCAVVRIRQVHGARVATAWRGKALPPPGIEADAAATDRAGLLLRILVADCLPIFLVDPERPAVALVHAGWRGIVAGVIESAVAALREGGVVPARLFAAAGPGIGPCCYEVGQEVAAALGRTAAPALGPRGRPHVDLFGAARARLVALGVPDGRIGARPPCTSCREDLFHSHRKSGGGPGRNEALLAILSA